MLKHSRKNAFMIAVIAAFALFSTYYFIHLESEERPDDAILSAIRDKGPVKPPEIKNETSLGSTEEGLHIKRDNGEVVKIQIQGATVGSFGPAQSQPAQ